MRGARDECAQSRADQQSSAEISLVRRIAIILRFPLQEFDKVEGILVFLKLEVEGILGFLGATFELIESRLKKKPLSSSSTCRMLSSA